MTRSTCALLLAALLSACGGGSGGPSAPEPAVSGPVFDSNIGDPSSPVGSTPALPTPPVPTISTVSYAGNTAPLALRSQTALTLNYALEESFAEINGTNGSLTNDMHAQISTKRTTFAQMRWTAFGGPARYLALPLQIWAAKTEGAVSLDFSLQNYACPTYTLEVTALRSTGTTVARTLAVSRVEDGAVLLATKDMANAAADTVVSIPVNRTRAATETLRISAVAVGVRSVKIIGNCTIADSDRDGLADPLETWLGSDPQKADSDSDGIHDGLETLWGLNPLAPADALADADGDDVSNKIHILRGMSPYGEKPVVANLEMSAVPASGNTLAARYSYYDTHFVPEGATVVEWIVNGVRLRQPTFTPTAADVGKTIQLAITPVKQRGQPQTGDTVTTGTYTILPSEADWSGEGPVTLRGRHDGHGVDLVILGDGFTAAEMGKFKQVAQKFVSTFQQFDTMAVHAAAWNIHAIGVPSVDSGVTDRNTTPETLLDTRYKSSLNGRLMVTNAGLANTDANLHFPQHDQVIVLVNTTKYGGSGGGVMVSSATPTSVGVSMHEIGHSFGGLADEYGYGGTTCPPTKEPGQPNVTINNNPLTVKWAHWITATATLPDTNPAKVGLSESALYCPKGVWKPTKNSLMQSNNAPMYAVNSEVWTLQVYRRVAPVVGAVPAQLEFTHDRNERQTFQAKTVFTPETQKIDWYLNGQLVAPNGGNSYQPPANMAGRYQVAAIASDKTGLILKDSLNRSQKTVVWTVTAY